MLVGEFGEFSPNFIILSPEDFRDTFCVAGVPLDVPDLLWVYELVQYQ